MHCDADSLTFLGGQHDRREAFSSEKESPDSQHNRVLRSMCPRSWEDARGPYVIGSYARTGEASGFRRLGEAGLLRTTARRGHIDPFD